MSTENIKNKMENITFYQNNSALACIRNGSKLLFPKKTSNVDVSKKNF